MFFLNSAMSNDFMTAFTLFDLRCFLLEAGIAHWYSAELRAGWSEVRVPAEPGNFFLHHRVQTGSGTHSASYPMATRGSFPGDKAAGAWSWLLTI
jgi:hypothetical protein